MRKSFILAILGLLSWFASAQAVDLAATFGASLPLNQISAQSCQLSAVHAGQTFKGSVGIAANGTDSAVISLQCLNIPVTVVIPTIQVNGQAIGNVSFPQTVTASAAGLWRIQINQNGPSLDVLAQ